MKRLFLPALIVVFLLSSYLLLASTASTGLPWQDFDFTPTAWLYLPQVAKNYPPAPTATATATATPTTAPTATPTLPSPSFDGCQEDPDPYSAGNYPVRIVTVFKTANPEAVQLQNVGAQTVNLTGWRMCSITGDQEHTGISGSLAPGETKDFSYTGGGFIWNNTERDDGALYNAGGQLVSYWIDQ
jgi:hypothetical protein